MGATFRLSATYYADELSDISLADAQNKIMLLSAYYTATTNATDLFFANDAGYWLVTVNCTSNDNGFSNRITADFTFNPDGWDTTGIYTDPFNGLPVFVNPDFLFEVSKPLNPANTDVTNEIPSPIWGAPGSAKDQEFGVDATGLGRWPQNRQVEHSRLRNLLYQNPNSLSDINIAISGAWEPINNISIADSNQP